MTAEKLEITAEVNITERSTTERAQAYGILLSTVSTYSKNLNSIENQALLESEVTK
jgi:hypothetical protein